MGSALITVITMIAAVSYTHLDVYKRQGYTNVLFQYHKLICRDASQKRVCIYNADTGKWVKEITDEQSDVLLSNRGVVYRCV